MRGGAKFGAVIALLLLHEGEVVPRDTLVDAIWGESPPPTADTALRGHVSKLRKLLEADPTVRLDTRGTGYVLEVEPGRLDLRRFEGSVDLGRSALGRGEFEDAERSLHEALALWRAEPLLEAIGPGARRDLLRVLTSSSEVRADVIRQFHERGKDVMTELLIALEENEAARQAVIEELRQANGR